ncbi:MAG: hypothetical protein ACO1RT_17705 [Planctomycetaceae bacterium]
MTRTVSIAFFACVLAFAFRSHAVLANDPLSKQASWKTPSHDQTVEWIRSSLDQLGVPAQKADAVIDLWAGWVEADDADPLTAFVQAIATAVPEVDKIVQAAKTSPTDAVPVIESSGWLSAGNGSMPPVIAASVRTWLARELVRARLYDEALPIFDSVEATDSVDPASVMFYRAVCRHSLLMKQESLADLRRLLENEADSPVRFVRTAHLMISDIKPLKEDSLDEISRLMTDVTRRLDLGRANEDVRQREQTIIDKLTKLIEKMEEQQQQQQQQQQAQQGQGQSNGGQGKPMDDSRIAGANGQGDVDRKKIGDRDGWGNLPPAEREEAMQQISRDLPTHYREAIEAYFRKLAVDKP